MEKIIQDGILIYFKKNHSSHPVIAKDIVITPEIIEQFFESIELNKPIIIKRVFIIKLI